MPLETLRSVFLWCSVIDYGLLLIWVIALVVARAPLLRLTDKFFRISKEQFELMNYGGLLAFKLAVFLFNITPLIALYLVK